MGVEGLTKSVPLGYERNHSRLAEDPVETESPYPGRGGGPAWRLDPGADGVWAGTQDPGSPAVPPSRAGGAVLSVPSQSRGGRNRGPESQRGRDGEAGRRRGAPDEGRGNARVREGRPPAPRPRARPVGVSGRPLRRPRCSPAPPLGQRARVRSGPRTSHPVPGRHPTQGPGVGRSPSGRAPPPRRKPGAAPRRAGCWWLQGGDARAWAHGPEVAASASALRLVKTRWTPSRQHPS